MLVNPKWDRWNRWLVRREFRTMDLKGHKTYGWKVTDPFDPTSDYVGTRWFETWDEAMAYANREWLRRKLTLMVGDLNDEVLDYLVNSFNEIFYAYSALGMGWIKEAVCGIIRA